MIEITNDIIFTVIKRLRLKKPTPSITLIRRVKIQCPDLDNDDVGKIMSKINNDNLLHRDTKQETKPVFITIPGKLFIIKYRLNTFKKNFNRDFKFYRNILFLVSLLLNIALIIRIIIGK